MINLTPSEAAILTGISPVQQRDWRRRGHMAGEGEGWNAFDAEQLSHLFILSVFSRQGRVADGARLAPILSGPLAIYLQCIIAGEAAAAPENAAAIWANGDIAEYPSVETALAQATDEQQGGPVTLIALSVLATPWAIKVRDYLAAKEG